MSETLLLTKLYIPEHSAAFVPRPRLSRQMDAGLGSRLVLISAPAGFGKTTLTASWAQALDQPVAWLSLDERDDEPFRFWSYVVGALQQALGGSLGGGALQLLADDPQRNLEPALTTLTNELTIRGETAVLVLDDYHAISDPSIHSGLTFMLKHLPPGLTLILATRADPPLRLARLRARGQMLEIRAADLRFQGHEAAMFLRNSTSVPLDADQVATLESRTEGWAVGLQLAALAIQGHADAAGFVGVFAGSHHYVGEYLMEEVLSQQPADVRDFLVRTAFLDELSAPLCNAVMGRDDGDEMLGYLLERNLFLIPLDPTGTWYRYHHLFADLLRYELGRTYTVGEVQALHRRASRWYEDAGRVGEAVDYALAGHAWEDAARLLEARWHNAAHRGELRTLRRWLDALPAGLVEASAPLNMAYCWLHYLAGEHGLVAGRLARVQQAWEARLAAGTLPDRVAWVIIPSLAASVAAILALQRKEPHAAVEHARQALALIPDDERVDRDLLAGSAAYRLVHAYRQLGQLDEAVETMRGVLAHLKRGQNFIAVANGAYALAQMLVELGRPGEARAACDEAIAYMQAHGHGSLPLTGMLHLALAEAASSEGRLQAAQEHLSRARALAEPSGYAAVLEPATALQEQLERAAAQPLFDPLSERELEVLRLLAEGFTNQQIADELVIALSTVKKHTGNIYGKLGVTTRTQAVLRAQELNLL